MKIENWKNRHTVSGRHFSSGPALLAWHEDKNGPAGRRDAVRPARGGGEAVRFSVEHRWRGVGAPSNTSSEGRVRVGGEMVRWWNELSPAVLGGVGVAVVAGGDGEGSLQHRRDKGEENGDPKQKDTEWWRHSSKRRKRRR
jgi:hypothetical protein